MIISKKKIILTYLLQKQLITKITNDIVYVNESSTQVLGIFYSFFLRKAFKKQIKANISFSLKLKIPSLNIFNSTVVSVCALFKSLWSNSTISLNLYKKRKKYYTVLRSPFVYKNSREFFFIENLIGNVTFWVGQVNCLTLMFLEDNLVFFLKGCLKVNNSLKKKIYFKI